MLSGQRALDNSFPREGFRQPGRKPPGARPPPCVHQPQFLDDATCCRKIGPVLLRRWCHGADLIAHVLG
eukprot:148267-Amphidinium_carterae.1